MPSSMLGLFFGAATALQTPVQSPPSAILFTNGRDAPPRPSLVTRFVKAEALPGWKVADDQTFVYTSPKHVTYIFLPSVRAINEYRALKYFRQQLEKDGLNATVKFSDLPAFMQSQLTTTFPQIDFQSGSPFHLAVDAVAQISGMGRKLNLHQLMMGPSTNGAFTNRMANLDPIADKAGTAPRDPDRPMIAEYQVFASGLFQESNRDYLIQDALTEFGREIARRSDDEKQSLIATFKDHEPFKSMVSQVGHTINLSTDRNSDPAYAALQFGFRQLLNQNGLTEGKARDEFVQQATIDSVTLGFRLEFARMMNGQKVMSSIRYSP